MLHTYVIFYELKLCFSGVVAPCHGVDNKVLQLHTTKSKPLD